MVRLLAQVFVGKTQKSNEELQIADDEEYCLKKSL